MCLRNLSTKVVDNIIVSYLLVTLYFPYFYMHVIDCDKHLFQVA